MKRTGWKRAAQRHRTLLLSSGVAALTLGLAPFLPHPHVYKQIDNLIHGRLTAAIDIFDLFLHGTPWIALLVATILTAVTAMGRPRSNET